jgi:AraC-like DNA-binding protein
MPAGHRLAPQADFRTHSSVRQEYRQGGREAFEVPLFPAETFETTMVRPPELGTGLIRSVLLGEGLAYLSTWLDAGPVETVSTGHSPDTVYIGFNLSETPLVSGTLDGEPWQCSHGDSCAAAAGSVMTLAYKPHFRLRMRALFIVPSLLVELAEQHEGGASIRPVQSLANGASRPHWSRMTREMMNILEQIETAPFHGGLKKLYLEGKILELLALRLARLADAGQPPAAPALRRRQIERLHEARALVEARMAAPVSLRRLSREVALSATLLKRGFRELFGETVFEHLRNLRLEEARRLLAEPDASVKEVARAIGYSSLSHFAHAFRDRFGVTPRAFARAHDGR